MARELHCATFGHRRTLVTSCHSIRLPSASKHRLRIESHHGSEYDWGECVSSPLLLRDHSRVTSIAGACCIPRVQETQDNAREIKDRPGRCPVGSWTNREHGFLQVSKGSSAEGKR